jgi:hypothetical protein
MRMPRLKLKLKLKPKPKPKLNLKPKLKLKLKRKVLTLQDKAVRLSITRIRAIVPSPRDIISMPTSNKRSIHRRFYPKLLVCPHSMCSCHPISHSNCILGFQRIPSRRSRATPWQVKTDM